MYLLKVSIKISREHIYYILQENAKKVNRWQQNQTDFVKKEYNYLKIYCQIIDN